MFVVCTMLENSMARSVSFIVGVLCDALQEMKIRWVIRSIQYHQEGFSKVVLLGLLSGTCWGWLFYIELCFLLFPLTSFPTWQLPGDRSCGGEGLYSFKSSLTSPLIVSVTLVCNEHILFKFFDVLPRVLHIVSTVDYN